MLTQKGRNWGMNFLPIEEEAAMKTILYYLAIQITSFFLAFLLSLNLISCVNITPKGRLTLMVRKDHALIQAPLLPCALEYYPGKADKNVHMKKKCKAYWRAAPHFKMKLYFFIHYMLLKKKKSCKKNL